VILPVNKLGVLSYFIESYTLPLNQMLFQRAVPSARPRERTALWDIKLLSYGADYMCSDASVVSTT